MYTTHVPLIKSLKKVDYYQCKPLLGWCFKNQNSKKEHVDCKPFWSLQNVQMQNKNGWWLVVLLFLGWYGYGYFEISNSIALFLDHNSQHSKGKLLIYRGHYIPSPNNALFLPYICIAWSHQKWVMTHDPWFTAPSCWICTSWIGSPIFRAIWCHSRPTESDRCAPQWDLLKPPGLTKWLPSGKLT